MPRSRCESCWKRRNENVTGNSAGTPSGHHVQARCHPPRSLGGRVEQPRNKGTKPAIQLCCLVTLLFKQTLAGTGLAEPRGPNEPQAAAPPKPFSPQPRSEGRIEILMT